MMDIKIRREIKDRIFLPILAVIFFSFSFCSAQQKFKPEDFKQWYKVGNMGVSNDGGYSNFIRKYDDRSIETVLLNNFTGKTEVSSPMLKSEFGHNSFVTLDQNGVLEFTNLKNHKQIKIKNVKDFYIPENDNSCYILTHNGQLSRPQADQLKTVLIAEKISRLENSEDKQWLLAMHGDGSWLIKFETGQKIDIGLVSGSNLVRWKVYPSYAKVDFLIKEGDHYKIITYSENGTLSKTQDIINPGNDYKFSGFTDGGHLIAVRDKSAKKLQDSIEVWRTSDLALKASLNKRESLSFDALIINPIDGTKSSYPYIEGITSRMLVFNDRYMLEVLDYANENFTDEHLIPGIRLRNLSSGAVEFEIQRCPSFSPTRTGKLFYFEGKNWWVYDPVLKTKQNLTATIDDQFFTYNRQNVKSTLPSADLYFSEDQKTAYLTGKNNIWKLDTATGNFTNLTHSKDKNISFEILNKSSEVIEKMKWTEYKTIREDWLLIKMMHRNQLQEGLVVIKDKKLTVIEPPQIMAIDNVVINNHFVTYTVENSGLPQQLRLYDVNRKKGRTLYSSNNSYFKSGSLPTSDLIYFTDRQGNDTYTTVILPPNYDPSKKYPAIVRIYENTASLVKQFVFPSFYNQSGFNRSLATMEGYIVIMPRIFYQINRPGESALEAVEEAVEQASLKYTIDKNRLGIIGESFGGFEVNYIIANTNMFKAAVSGVSLSDITASYFSMSKKFLRPDIWRYTDQSFRFSGNFYELKDVYFKQNPVFNADRIETPLLIWTGKEDNHVDWEQSVAMFIALKSLGKPAELILFPKDGHALARSSNQVQATIKIVQWFDNYLK